MSKFFRPNRNQASNLISISVLSQRNLLKCWVTLNHNTHQNVAWITNWHKLTLYSTKSKTYKTNHKILVKGSKKNYRPNNWIGLIFKWSVIRHDYDRILWHYLIHVSLTPSSGKNTLVVAVFWSKVCLTFTRNSEHWISKRNIVKTCEDWSWFRVPVYIPQMSGGGRELYGLGEPTQH